MSEACASRGTWGRINLDEGPFGDVDSADENPEKQAVSMVSGLRGTMRDSHLYGEAGAIRIGSLWL